MTHKGAPIFTNSAAKRSSRTTKHIWHGLEHRRTDKHFSCFFIYFFHLFVVVHHVYPLSIVGAILLFNIYLFISVLTYFCCPLIGSHTLVINFQCSHVSVVHYFVKWRERKWWKNGHTLSPVLSPHRWRPRKHTSCLFHIQSENVEILKIYICQYWLRSIFPLNT